ncbi:MAG TPA: hypothetical protein VMU87_15590 [Stellaceae bacterium]|nr:hypothetical protein [Stellaceae bacterium]
MPFDPGYQELRLIALEKIERVIGLLGDRDRWCKGALRTDDGRMCILGAVREADAELLLYAPILRAVREVTGNAYRQIEKFNDSWLTSHALVLDVLDRVREDLAVGVVAGAPGRAQRQESSPRPAPVFGGRLAAGIARLVHRLRAL